MSIIVKWIVNILCVVILFGSIWLNIYLLNKKPATSNEIKPQIVYQNKIQYIEKTITNQAYWNYVDLLNQYLTNDFDVTNSKENLTVRLVDRYVNIKIDHKNNDNIVHAAYYLLDGFGVSYGRRIIDIFGSPLFLGPSVLVTSNNFKIGVFGSFEF